MEKRFTFNVSTRHDSLLKNTHVKINGALREKMFTREVIHIKNTSLQNEYVLRSIQSREIVAIESLFLI